VTDRNRWFREDNSVSTRMWMDWILDKPVPSFFFASSHALDYFLLNNCSCPLTNGRTGYWKNLCPPFLLRVRPPLDHCLLNYCPLLEILPFRYSYRSNTSGSPSTYFCVVSLLHNFLSREAVDLCVSANLFLAVSNAYTLF
jgi:hypothetical protein